MTIIETKLEDILMEITLGNIVTIGVALISVAFGYGMLNQRVKSLESKVSEIDEIKAELHKISDTLQKLSGQFEMFIKMNCKGE